jgi:hypothetical protein
VRGSSTLTQQDVLDRRRSVRHVLRVPIRLRICGSSEREAWGHSVNLSGSGVLLETDLALAIGMDVELGLTLLEEITGQPTMEWRCQGHVVQVAPQRASSGESRFGVRFDSIDATRPGVNGRRHA